MISSQPTETEELSLRKSGGEVVSGTLELLVPCARKGQIFRAAVCTYCGVENWGGRWSRSREEQIQCRREKGGFWTFCQERRKGLLL